jgi:transcriptional regulator with XRE-family HTH domain
VCLVALTVRVNGSRIREARLVAGMTQAQLSRAISTSEKNIARWETSQNQPRISSVAAIAKATGHDIDFFLTGTEDADEDEEAAVLTLDDYLRIRVRQIIGEITVEQRA